MPPNIILDLFRLLAIPYSCILVLLHSLNSLCGPRLSQQVSTRLLFFTFNFFKIIPGFTWMSPVAASIDSQFILHQRRCFGYFYIHLYIQLSVILIKGEGGSRLCLKLWGLYLDL